jgi:hypothetical protein
MSYLLVYEVCDKDQVYGRVIIIDIWELFNSPLLKQQFIMMALIYNDGPGMYVAM